MEQQMIDGPATMMHAYKGVGMEERETCRENR